jgi:predicted PP-loop superfamily ATPase
MKRKRRYYKYGKMLSEIKKQVDFIHSEAVLQKILREIRRKFLQKSTGPRLLGRGGFRRRRF